MFLVSRKAIQKSLSVGMLMLLVSVSARAQYTIKNVGSLEVGKSSAANAVNNHGQVVGVSDTSDGWRAFMYSGSSMLNLGALAGGTDASGRLFKFSTANSINDSGEAVGESITPQGQRPTLYSQGKVASLGTLDNGFNTYANDINSHGQIVGWAATYAGTRAFLYEGSGMQDIGSLAGFGNTSAYAIDDIGQVVGSSETARGQRAFLYYQGDMINLGTLPGVVGAAHSG